MNSPATTLPSCLTNQDSRIITVDRAVLKEGTLLSERFRSTPLLGSAAVGTSGAGKTTGFDNAVRTYPQVITWLKINLFQDACSKAFGIESFEKLCEAAGENRRRKGKVEKTKERESRSDLITGRPTSPNIQPAPTISYEMNDENEQRFLAELRATRTLFNQST